MANEKEKDDQQQDPKRQRPLDPVAEAAMPAGPIPLLEKFQSVIGFKLRKLGVNEGVTLERTGTKWFWSWTPEQVAMFLQSWDSQVYMASPLLRDLAMTPDPVGGGMIYERFCPPAIVDAIRKIQIMYDRPLGKLRPVPKGKFSIDLRVHPPNVRPTIFRINDWEFWGFVQGITEGLRDELAYRHSRWYQREARVMDTADHADEDLGALNRPAGR